MDRFCRTFPGSFLQYLLMDCFYRTFPGPFLPYLFLDHFLERVEGADGGHVLRGGRVGDPAPALGGAAATLLCSVNHEVNLGKHLRWAKAATNRWARRVDSNRYRPATSPSPCSSPSLSLHLCVWTSPPIDLPLCSISFVPFSSFSRSTSFLPSPVSPSPWKLISLNPPPPPYPSSAKLLRAKHAEGAGRAAPWFVLPKARIVYQPAGKQCQRDE